MKTTTPYENLVEAAARLTDVEAFADIDETNASSVSGLLRRNRFVLESARRVLGPGCVVPLRYEESFFSKHCESFSHLRNLARVFQAEAALAASNHDFRAVAGIGIDTLELANAARRGGLMTDLLVGIAISGIAMNSLRKVRNKWDTGTRRSLIEELHRLEAEREPFAEVVARDQEWEVAAGYDHTPCDFLSQELHQLSDPKECGLSEEEQKEVFQLVQQIAVLPEPDRRMMFRNADFHILALMRMLAIDLGLREYCEKSGSFPHDLRALTPQTLTQLPLDPFTASAFIYRRTGASLFELYSTGPKLIDGFARFGHSLSVAAGCADLCLDENDYLPDCCNRKTPELEQSNTPMIRRWWHVWRR